MMVENQLTNIRRLEKELADTEAIANAAKDAHIEIAIRVKNLEDYQRKLDERVWALVMAVVVLFLGAVGTVVFYKPETKPTAAAVVTKK